MIQDPNPIDPTCECGDMECPMHWGVSKCNKEAITTLFRVDMEDETGTLMCEGCANDAMASQLFYEKEEGE